MSMAIISPTIDSGTADARSVAPDSRPRRTDHVRLVFLDAFVADDGQSMFDLLRPARRRVYEESSHDGLIDSPLSRAPPPRRAANSSSSIGL